MQITYSCQIRNMSERENNPQKNYRRHWIKCENIISNMQMQIANNLGFSRCSIFLHVIVIIFQERILMRSGKYRVFICLKYQYLVFKIISKDQRRQITNSGYTKVLEMKFEVPQKSERRYVTSYEVIGYKMKSDKLVLEEYVQTGRKISSSVDVLSSYVSIICNRVKQIRYVWIEFFF